MHDVLHVKGVFRWKLWIYLQVWRQKLLVSVDLLPMSGTAVRAQTRKLLQHVGRLLLIITLQDSHDKLLDTLRIRFDSGKGYNKKLV